VKRPATDTTLKLPSHFSATVKALLKTPRPPRAAEIVHVDAKTALAWSREAAVRSRELHEAGDALRARVVPASRKGRIRALAALARALAYGVKNGGQRAAGGETRLEGAFVGANHDQLSLLRADLHHAPTMRCPHCGARLIVMHRDPADPRLVSYHCMTHGAFVPDSEGRLLKEPLSRSLSSPFSPHQTNRSDEFVYASGSRGDAPQSSQAR
jgi:DNA-directed RNA polymerase subunit RPC12/RpoP